MKDGPKFQSINLNTVVSLHTRPSNNGQGKTLKVPETRDIQRDLLSKVESKKSYFVINNS